MKKCFVLPVLLLFSKIAISQITVASTSPQQCLDALIGSNVSYNFVSSQGNANQFGIFNGVNSNIGFNSGMVLSTAAVNPPNGFAPPQFLMGANSGGYQPLSNLVNGLNTFNASVITFQFTPIGDTIKFRYVFGSMEYPGFVCSGFNDVFGFLLSGPNPAGGNYNNTNIALIPNTTIPVTINNVNAGNTGGACTPPGGGSQCPCNSQYFVNNYSPNQGTVNISGFTTPLTAIAAVIPCSTYTITLAVADVGDGALNSAVFLEANSFISPVITLNPTASIGGVDTVLYEGCSFAEIEIFRNYNIDQQTTYNLQISGTAVDGTDYSGIPQTVTFLPGDSSETITLTTINNPFSNSNSYVTITIQDTVCGTNGIITSSITLDIINIDTLNVDIGPDLLSCDTINIPSIVTGGLAPYTYSWNNGQYTTPNINNYILTGPTTFILEVADNCNHTASDTVIASVLNSPTAYLDITASDIVVNEECGTVQITITRQALIDQARTYPLLLSGTATPTADYTIPTSFSFAVNQVAASLTLTPVWDGIAEGLEYITLTTVDTLCNGTFVYDSVRINIIDIAPLSLDAGQDLSTGCPIMPQNLMPTPGGGTQPYTWSWSTGETTQNITAEPANSTSYTVTMTDDCGNEISDEILVETYYPPIASFHFTSANWCEPALVVFTNTSQSVSGNIDTYAWDFGNGETTDAPDPTNIYHTDGNYEVTLIVTNSYGCTDTISHSVTVNPLPTASFYWEPSNPTTNNPLVDFIDNSSSNVTSWLWQIDHLSTSTEQNPQQTFNIPGDYKIWLTVTTEFGCTDTIQRIITVITDPTFFIPSAFTPANGDDLNMTFKPAFTYMSDYSMHIYNRWGELLFSTHNGDEGWDGKNPQGKMVKSDIYVYKIFVKDIYGKQFEYYGHVTVMGDM